MAGRSGRSACEAIGRPKEVVRALLRWYASHGRDLPWRRSPDPYRVLVSEIMLQQTTVETAWPYFERFLAAWPDVRALARADESDVLALWSGLGYYRRARNLLAAARSIASDHGGRVPSDAAALRRLPGIGPYTAAAVLAIAHGRAEIALDGNLRRVLARLLAFRGDPAGRAGGSALTAAGEALVRAGDPSAVNQALMDVGATVCTPRAPGCDLCPLRRFCAAKRLGLESSIPPPRARSRSVRVTLEAAVLRRRGRFLLRRRGGSLLKGMWEFPMVEAGGVGRAGEALVQDLERGCAFRVSDLRPAGEVRHTITRHRIRVLVFAGEAGSARRTTRREWDLAEPGGTGDLAGAVSPGVARWFAPERITSLPLTGIARKILSVLGTTNRERGEPRRASGQARIRRRDLLSRPGSGTPSSGRSASAAPSDRRG